MCYSCTVCQYLELYSQILCISKHRCFMSCRVSSHPPPSLCDYRIPCVHMVHAVLHPICPQRSPKSLRNVMSSCILSSFQGSSSRTFGGPGCTPLILYESVYCTTTVHVNAGPTAFIEMNALFITDILAEQLHIKCASRVRYIV